MHHTCAQCSADFEITDSDLAFYDKVSPIFNGKKELIPPPTQCPDCRLQRRLAFRNQIYVYRATSAQTGKEIFSRFPASSPFPITENEWWFGESWDPLQYGLPVTENQSCFATLTALRNTVPHRALSLTQSENSDYCNNNTNLKNCYMVFNSSFSEDSMYCDLSVRAKDCIDCSNCPGCELCYDSTACTHSYNLRHCSYSEECSDSHYLHFCRSCKNCFGCVNLRHKEYCIFNEQKTKEEYDAFIAQYRNSSFADQEHYKAEMLKFAVQHPRPHAIFRQTEEVEGDFIQEARHVDRSFFIQNAEDIRNGYALYEGVKDCQDYSFFGIRAELLYECIQCGIDVQHLLFCFDCWDGNSDLLYCIMCHGSKDCFGCVGLRKKQYCIFNTQYTKEEYETLVPQIISRMRKSGEWGEFFPISFSPTPYNHSTAQYYFPLSEKECAAQSYLWHEEHFAESAQAIDAWLLPDGLPDSDTPIVVKSMQSGKPFKITTQEIKRYRQLGIPLPRLAYNERMEKRGNILGGIHLYDRTCMKTGKPIKTTIPPDSPWIVWDRDVWEQEFGS